MSNGACAAFLEFPRGEIEQSIPSRFHRQVAVHGSRIAVKTRRQSLTYHQLNLFANRIAGSIVARRGKSPESVALLLRQGLASTASILGVLKAGKYYVPLDPLLPPDRTAHMLENSKSRLIVTDSRHLPLAKRIGASGTEVIDLDKDVFDLPEEDLDLAASPDHLAYIFYTSGSTGRPKGVMDSHRNVLHNIMRYTNRLRIGSEDRLTLLQSPSFSGSVSSLFCALLNGSCVFPCDLGEETPGRIAEWIREEQITIYHSVPSIFRGVTEGGGFFPSVRVIRLEGDQASRLDVDLYRRHFGENCILANGLGTTETGIVCQYVMDRETPFDGDRVPVGHPLQDMQILLLDESGTGTNEADQPREIAVRSEFLSLGYWGNPGRTEAAFLPDPDGGNQRIYQTGDLGRLRPDGCLELFGRSGNMIKIQGQWVVPGEIESAILSIDGVKEAVVSSWQDAGNEVRIIAYLVPADRSAPSVTLLRQRLGEILPSHMVPTNYVWLERLPLSANGKIDRRMLPSPSGKRPELQHPFLPPQSLLQLRIAQIWEELLDVQPVGIRDNFFDLGGHSLLAAILIDRIERLFGRRLPLSILYKSPDIESLADAMVSDEKDLQAPIVTIQSRGSKTPFFFLHGDYLTGGFFTMELARCLGRERPFHALPPYGLDGGPVPPSYEGMADLHLENLRAFRPHGPYLLGGVCNGGLVAFEMARRLLSEGEKVEQLVLIAASASGVRFRWLGLGVHGFSHLAGLRAAAKRRLSRRIRDLILNMGSVPLHRRPGHILKKATKIPGELAELVRLSRRTGRGITDSPAIESGQESAQDRRARIRDIYHQIDKDYIPGAYPGRITLLWAEEDQEPPQDALRYWKKVSPNVKMHVIPGDYTGILTINLKTLGERLRMCLS